MTDEQAKYLDKMREAMGGVAVHYDSGIPGDTTYPGITGVETLRKRIMRAVVGFDPTDPVPLSDKDLLDAYQRTDGELSDPEADALVAEIKKRGLDI